MSIHVIVGLGLSEDLSLADATRNSPEFALGVSTRAVQSLFRATQAMALCEGRHFATPDDVQRVANPVLAHRVVLHAAGGGLNAARDVIDGVIASVPVPL